MGRFLRIMSSVETAIMTVNQEIKGNLAKLLATENLVIEHKKSSDCLL